MRKLFLALLFCLVTAGSAFSQRIPTTLVDWRGQPQPPVSQPNHGTLYFDQTSKTFKISTDGGAYTTLTALSGSGVNGQVTLFSGATTLAGNTGFTYSGTGATFQTVTGGITVGGTTASGTGVYLSAANVLGFVTNGTERWVINSSGALNPTSSYDIGNGIANPRDLNLARNLVLYGATSGSVTLNASATGGNAVLNGSLLFTPTNSVDIGTNATTLAPRTVYAGTSVVAPLGSFTTVNATNPATTATIQARYSATTFGVSLYGVNDDAGGTILFGSSKGSADTSSYGIPNKLTEGAGRLQFGIGTQQTGVASTARLSVFSAPFGTNQDATELFTIEGDGKVGIGTTVPETTLEVSGGNLRVLGGAGGGTVPTTGSGIEVSYNTNSDAGIVLAFNRSTSTYKVLDLRGSPLILNATNGANVGIGTVSPRALLDISTGSLVGTGLTLPHTINKAASANVRNSHDAIATSTSATYVKSKTITLTNGLVGAARFLFDLGTDDNTVTVDGKIYRNGVALGTEQTTASGVGSVTAINAVPTAGGVGYTVNDVLTITVGGTLCTVTADTVVGGAVTHLTLTTGGRDYTTGAGKATSGGTGTGCTVEITTVSDYVTKSEDITQTWNPGDTVELWIHSNGTAAVRVRNFRLAYDDSPLPAVGSVNSTP